MQTLEQVRWMALIELLNSDEFHYPCTWFEDSHVNWGAADRSGLLASGMRKTFSA
jgi:hypothetical protein